MTRYSIREQSKQSLFEKRMEVYILLCETLNNYRKNKNAMDLGNPENSFLEGFGFRDHSTMLLYLMTGHEIIANEASWNEKIAGSDIERKVLTYISNLDKAILQFDLLFDYAGSEVSDSKEFLKAYRDYLSRLIDYKLSAEYGEDVGVLEKYNFLKKEYKNINLAGKKIIKDNQKTLTTLKNYIMIDRHPVKKILSRIMINRYSKKKG